MEPFNDFTSLLFSHLLCTLTCLDSIGNEDNIDNIDRVRITTMKKALTQIIRIQTK